MNNMSDFSLAAKSHESPIVAAQANGLPLAMPELLVEERVLVPDAPLGSPEQLDPELEVPDDKLLASSVREAITKAQQSVTLSETATQWALNYAMEAGRLLLDIKKRVGHGNFCVWLETNLSDVSRSTISRYMRLARKWSQVNILGKSPKTQREALQCLEERNCASADGSSPSTKLETKSEKNRILAIGAKIQRVIAKADLPTCTEECIRALEEVIQSFKKTLRELKAKKI